MWNGITFITFIQDWIERRQWFAKICTGPAFKNVCEEVTKCDVCQCTKRSTKKYDKLPAKLSEEITWNKLCVDFIFPYKISRKGVYPTILKAVTIIDPVTGWCEITQYNDKKSMTIANLVETMCLVLYIWTVEITYDRGGKFLVH